MATHNRKIPPNEIFHWIFFQFPRIKAVHLDLLWGPCQNLQQSITPQYVGNPSGHPFKHPAEGNESKSLYGCSLPKESMRTSFSITGKWTSRNRQVHAKVHHANYLLTPPPLPCIYMYDSYIWWYIYHILIYIYIWVMTVCTKYL